MSNGLFIKFDGVNGESTDEQHKGEIEVLSWNWGLSHATGATEPGGSGAGKAQKQDFAFTHVFDKASPALARQCVTGKRFKSVKFTARKSGEGQGDFLSITMKDVAISSVQSGGSSDGDAIEQVSCDYKDIAFAYRAQDNRGGLEDEVKFGWNTVTQKTR